MVIQNKSAVIIIIVCLCIIQLTTASLESDFLDLLNKERAKLNLQPLYYSSLLEKAGALHSQDTATKNYFSHTSPDGTTFVERVKQQNYSPYFFIGENIAMHSGTASADNVFSLWMNSEPHKKNMLSSNYNEAGLGIFFDGKKTHYTLDLGKLQKSIISLQQNNSQDNSKNVSDTNQPHNDSEFEIESIIFKMNKKRVNFFIKIDGNNAKKVSYTDAFDKKPREKTLCINPKNNVCMITRTFAKGDHALTMLAQDANGNTATKTIEFTI